MHKKDFELLAQTLAYTFVYNDNNSTEVKEMLSSILNHYEYAYPNFNRDKFIEYLSKRYEKESELFDKQMATEREKSLAVRIPLSLLG